MDDICDAAVGTLVSCPAGKIKTIARFKFFVHTKVVECQLLNPLWLLIHQQGFDRPLKDYVVERLKESLHFCC